ncbi:UDP-glycosyltransferase 88F5 [Vitis vinifera]|uniref:UDP-glycosyltransferase 88F5 n=1 Tax=Vitis vinifera TaxID=29760 RepID=A0A438BMR1_VITVI|nr:UDP-glycosyltransferase 88F5 [Vitis vinifera]
MIEPLLDREDRSYHQSLQFSLDLRKCDGVLTNTFDGLEPIALMAITNGECVTDGPSLRGSFSREQVKEIAYGLERSGQRFLWVLKIPPVDNKSKEIKQENLVAVLRHQSVGGFVTHCGWNSVLEAVSAGVPMVAWPLHAEQHLNMAVLVENMKMAIGVEQRNGDRFVSGAELERRLKGLMDSEEGRDLRERINKTREMAVEAWREEGSSTTALAKLADIWKHDHGCKLVD